MCLFYKKQGFSSTSKNQAAPATTEAQGKMENSKGKGKLHQPKPFPQIQTN